MDGKSEDQGGEDTWEIVQEAGPVAFGDSRRSRAFAVRSVTARG